MTITVEQVRMALLQSDGLDARAIAERLRRSNIGDAHKRDVNPILYSRSDLFCRFGDAPPVWTLRVGATQPPVAVVRPSSGTPAQAEGPRPYIRPGTSAGPAKPGPTGATTPVKSAPQNETAPATPPLGLVPPGNVSIESAAWPLHNLTPYRWQLEAYSWWLSQGSQGIVEAVTGTGKTIVGLAALANACATQKRALLLVPTIVLQGQWAEKIQREIPYARVTLLGGSGSSARALPPHDILIAVINSAASAAQQLEGAYRCVVADECHRYGAPTFQRALLQCAEQRLGLTATLERLDEGVDETLRPYFGPASFVYDLDRATSDRVLASFIVAHVGIDLTEEERKRFDIVDDQCRRARATLINQYSYPAKPSEFMPKAAKAAKKLNTFFGEGKHAKSYMAGFSQRIKILAETPARLDALRRLSPIIKLSGGTLAFTETVDMADRAAKALRHEDVKAQAFHSEVSAGERQIRLAALQRGTLQAIVGVKALDEGVDVPDVDLGIIMSASHQKRQMIQRLGRIVRKKSDDRFAVLVNFYAKDTSEDPTQGAHEGFSDAIKNGADEIKVFPDGPTSALSQFLLSYLGMGRAVVSEMVAAVETAPIGGPVNPPISRTSLVAPHVVRDVSPEATSNARVARLEKALKFAQATIKGQEEKIDELRSLIEEYRRKLAPLDASAKMSLTGTRPPTTIPLQSAAPAQINIRPPSPVQVAKPYGDTHSRAATMDRFANCRQCGGDGRAGGRCPRCGGNGFEPSSWP